MTIEVTMRPIREMFTINNVLNDNEDKSNVNTFGDNYDNMLNEFYQRIQPNFSNERHSLYRFLQLPPTIELVKNDYKNKINNWNADVHIIAVIGF